MNKPFFTFIIIALLLISNQCIAQISSTNQTDQFRSKLENIESRKANLILPDWTEEFKNRLTDLDNGKNIKRNTARISDLITRIENQLELQEANFVPAITLLDSLVSLGAEKKHPARWAKALALLEDAGKEAQKSKTTKKGEKLITLERDLRNLEYITIKDDLMKDLSPVISELNGRNISGLLEKEYRSGMAVYHQVDSLIKSAPYKDRADIISRIKVSEYYLNKVLGVARALENKDDLSRYLKGYQQSIENLASRVITYSEIQRNPIYRDPEILAASVAYAIDSLEGQKRELEQFVRNGDFLINKLSRDLEARNKEYEERAAEVLRLRNNSASVDTLSDDQKDLNEFINKTYDTFSKDYFVFQTNEYLAIELKDNLFLSAEEDQVLTSKDSLMERIADFASKYRELQVDFIVHTHLYETEETNQEKSEERAALLLNRVKEKAKIEDISNWRPEGMGDQYPFRRCDSSTGCNERVIIRINNLFN